MSHPPPPQRNPADEVQFWLNYIDCALKHPRPLPSGKHVYRATLETVPEVRDLYHCLYKLYTEESSSVNFREPVNALALGVFNYYDVVKNPMSLRVVLDRIVEGEYYSSAEQVLRDVELIWQNCAAFNGESSPITGEAKKCAAALERMRQAFHDEQLASQDEVNHLADVIESSGDDGMLEALMDYFRCEDPGMVDQRDLDLTRLKVKHVRAMKDIVDRYVAKKGTGH